MQLRVFLRSRYRIGIYFWVAKISSIFGVLEIPENFFFFGERWMLGPSLSMRKKLESPRGTTPSPPPPPPAHSGVSNNKRWVYYLQQIHSFITGSNQCHCREKGASKQITVLISALYSTVVKKQNVLSSHGGFQAYAMCRH